MDAARGPQSMPEPGWVLHLHLHLHLRLHLRLLEPAWSLEIQSQDENDAPTR